VSTLAMSHKVKPNVTVCNAKQESINCACLMSYLWAEQESINCVCLMSSYLWAEQESINCVCLMSSYLWAEQESINSVCLMSSYLWAADGKCGVFITSHSHQSILISIPIPMKLAQRFLFSWAFHGTHGTRYRLISTCPLRAATHGQTMSADNYGLCVTDFRLWLMIRSSSPFSYSVCFCVCPCPWPCCLFPCLSCSTN